MLPPVHDAFFYFSVFCWIDREYSRTRSDIDNFVSSLRKGLYHARMFEFKDLSPCPPVVKYGLLILKANGSVVTPRCKIIKLFLPTQGEMCRVRLQKKKKNK
jgi:hypothetical protein